MPEKTNIGRYLALSSSAFTSSDDNVLNVWIMWGLKNQDISECHHTNVSCFGKTVWDDTFNLNSVEAQVALKVRVYSTIYKDILCNKLVVCSTLCYN